MYIFVLQTVKYTYNIR